MNVPMLAHSSFPAAPNANAITPLSATCETQTHYATQSRHSISCPRSCFSSSPRASVPNHRRSVIIQMACLVISISISFSFDFPSRHPPSSQPGSQAMVRHRDLVRPIWVLGPCRRGVHKHTQHGPRSAIISCHLPFFRANLVSW